MARTIVPVALGKVIVLSAVGSSIDNVVSCASAEAPSNTNAFCTFTTVWLTVVVVPCTVKSPVTVKSLPIVTSFGKPTVNVVPENAVSISLAVPAIVKVSEPKVTEPEPVPPATVEAIVLDAVST